MGEVITGTVKMSIPDKRELDALYDLGHAGEALQDRFTRDTTDYLADMLENVKDDLSDEDYAFLMKAWSVLVDNPGGLFRLLGAYSTWQHTCQHPGLDYVEFSAPYRQAFEDAALMDVYKEAYLEAQARVAFLENSFVIFKAEDLLNEATETNPKPVSP